MPCMFKLPSVMVTHCALSAQHIQRWAKDDPYVYTGDFNIKPDSSQYQLLTQGNLETKVYNILVPFLFICTL
jgi:endonuclease/exonuclease/phosphatase family metal-dependent hydrolase